MKTPGAKHHAEGWFILSGKHILDLILLVPGQVTLHDQWIHAEYWEKSGHIFGGTLDRNSKGNGTDPKTLKT